jgi:diphthine-ammonia ligase
MRLGEPRRRIGLLFSGGKDSTFACAKLLEKGYDVLCLITLFSENQESYMLHTASIEMTELSAQAINIPLIRGYTKGEKERELDDIRRTILRAKEEFSIDCLGTGAIASQYQKSRVDSIGSSCGLDVVSPLWGVNQAEYMRFLIKNGYSFLLTSVSCEGLGPEWLGREVNSEDLDELDVLSKKFGFNIAFEGGEAETLVLDCPLFREKRISIVDSSKVWNGYYGLLKITKATLVEKQSKVRDERL